MGWRRGNTYTFWVNRTRSVTAAMAAMATHGSIHGVDAFHIGRPLSWYG